MTRRVASDLCLPDLIVTRGVLAWRQLGCLALSAASNQCRSVLLRKCVASDRCLPDLTATRGALTWRQIGCLGSSTVSTQRQLDLLSFCLGISISRVVHMGRANAHLQVHTRTHTHAHTYITHAHISPCKALGVHSCSLSRCNKASLPAETHFAPPPLQTHSWDL